MSSQRKTFSSLSVESVEANHSPDSDKIISQNMTLKRSQSLLLRTLIPLRGVLELVGLVLALISLVVDLKLALLSVSPLSYVSYLL